MIKSYTLKYHRWCKAQSFVNYIFLEVICRAPHLKGNLNGKMIISKYKIFLSKQINENYILKPLQKIYCIVRGLPPEKIKVIRRAVLTNNRIRELCLGLYTPVSYADIEKIDKDLSDNIKLFCNHLYKEVTKLKPFYEKYNTLDDYYKELIGSMTECGCCGVGFILNRYHLHRSALDHYLPKDKYPFVSINVKNLVPICDTCNAKYKLARDTLYLEKKAGNKEKKYERIKAFYPFCRNNPDIQIGLDIKKGCRMDKLTPEDIHLSFTCKGREEEVNNWRRLFGIDNQYEALYCSDDLMAFCELGFIVAKGGDKLFTKFMEGLKKNKYADRNFLKIPLLEYLVDDQELFK